MNACQRFYETLNFGTPDRVPLFQEGIREEVLATWHLQGMPVETDLGRMFHYDELEEIEPELDPYPSIPDLQTNQAGLKKLKHRLDPNDPWRLPTNWHKKVRNWQNRQHVLLLRIHRGYFLTMGVEGWQSFKEAIRLLIDEPAFVQDVLGIQADFAVRLAERILQEVKVDGVIFSEPISGNHGPLISPKMYEDFVLRSYDPILNIIEKYKVKYLILRTYANPHALLPVAFKSRFNCLWACECNSEAMDFRKLRAEFGSGLRLIGGIDTDVLRQDKPAIRRELEEKVLPLLAEGGFIPLADGRVREDIPYQNYVFYRRLLEDITSS
jgi:hypothetical protein